MLVPWLTDSIIKFSREITIAGVGIFRLDRKVAEILDEKPIQEWEADRWMRGLKLRLIRMENHFFRVGSGKRSAFSLFVRNEKGLNVGLKREAITQMATYVSLITDFGYSRFRTQFETGFMDVAVFDETNDVLIYAENKASQKTLEKLCSRLETEFVDEIPTIPVGEDGKLFTHSDVLMKAHHIWKHKPYYFWGRSPTGSFTYRVIYHRFGFGLQPIGTVPSAFEMQTAASF